MRNVDDLELGQWQHPSPSAMSDGHDVMMPHPALVSASSPSSVGTSVMTVSSNSTMPQALVSMPMPSPAAGVGYMMNHHPVPPKRSPSQMSNDGRMAGSSSADDPMTSIELPSGTSPTPSRPPSRPRSRGVSPTTEGQNRRPRPLDYYEPIDGPGRPTRRRNSGSDDGRMRPYGDRDRDPYRDVPSPSGSVSGDEDWGEDESSDGRGSGDQNQGSWRKKLWSRLFPPKRPKKKEPREPRRLSHPPGELDHLARKAVRSETVPVVFVWNEYVASRNVSVTGTFCDPPWGQFYPMIWEDNEFYTIVNIRPGPYQYKFVVDNQWRFAKDQETRSDERGIINNHIDVRPLKIDESPIVPTEDDDADTYMQHIPTMPAADPAFRGRAGSPPLLPPHLRDEYAPLNVNQALNPILYAGRGRPIEDASKLACAPMSVQLDHVYTAPACSDGITIFSISHRHRTKCTTVIYITRPHNVDSVV